MAESLTTTVAVKGGWIQPTLAVAVITGLTAINVFGARSGARVVWFFTVAKLIPLALFILVGFTAIEGAQFEPLAPKGYGDLAETTLLVLYAYVGFETLVVPAGEMANPARAVPRALLLVMGIVTDRQQRAYTLPHAPTVVQCSAALFRWCCYACG